MPPVKKQKRDRDRTFLREWREFRDLKLWQAAERLEITEGTLSRIERGESPYNQDFLERAALAYGCEASELLSIDPLRPDAPRLVYDRLRGATKEVQGRALAILDALLKAS